MKVIVLYRPESEFARIVEEYAHDFERTKGKAIELVSIDSREGIEMAKLYDTTVYPALLAIRDDGQLLKDWQGAVFPLMNEVAAYTD